MTAQPITPDTWQRLPWHAQAKINARLDRETREIRETLAPLAARRDELTTEIAALEDRARSLKLWLDLREKKPGPVERVLWASEDLWTYDELKAAHSAYTRGERDDWTVIGNRLWERLRARRRKMPTCPDCGQPKAIGSAKCPDCRGVRTA